MRDRLSLVAFLTGAALLSGMVWGASPALGVETTPPELMPGVQISLGDQTGTDFAVHRQEGIELQLTPTGPETFLKIYNRPAWLTYDWTTQRVYGTASVPVGVYGFTVIARNAHDAISKTIMIEVKQQRGLKILSQELRFVGMASETVNARQCPPDAPVLNSVEYHPGSGLRIPPGVELVITTDAGDPIPLSGSGIDAFISGYYPTPAVGNRLAGTFDGGITHWTGGIKNVTVLFHCDR